MTHLRIHPRHSLMLALAILSLLAMGCSTPKQTITYYVPSGGWNTSVSSSTGPANEANIALPGHDGLSLMVVAQPSYDPARIWMSIHLPEGKTLRVADEPFLVTPRDQSKEAWSEPITYIRGTFIIKDETVYRRFTPGQDLPGASTPTITRFWGKPTTIPRQFEIVAHLKQPLPDRFVLTLPGMEIDGQPLRLPALHFSKEVGSFPIPQNQRHHPW